MQPVNFHIEPLRIGNLFNSKSFPISSTHTWTGLLGGFGATAVRQVVAQAGNTALLPCVYTFSKDYDFSEPYQPQNNESTSARLDSTFQPHPPQGWFGLGNTSGIQLTILALDYFQTAPWFHVAFDKSATESDIDMLGSRNRAAAVNNPLGAAEALVGGGANSSSNVPISAAFVETIDSAIDGIVSNAASQYGWTGILGNMDSMLFFNVSVNKTLYTNFINQSINSNQSSLNSIQALFTNNFTLSVAGFDLTGLQPLPWFNNTDLTSNDDLDDLISNDILTTVHQLNFVNASSIRLGYWHNALFRYPAVALAIQIVSNMPWGVLRFGRAENGTYEYMIQSGSDSRLLYVASYPPEGLRKMAFQTMFSNAIRFSPLR